MKTKLILAVLMLFTLHLKAQVVKFGIMGGISSEAIKIDQVPNGVTSLIKGNGIVGGEAGIFLKAKIIEPIYIQPELLFHYASGIVSTQNSDGTDNNATFTYFKAEVPLMFGLNVLGPLSVQAGPVYNYNIATNKNFDGERVNVQPSGFGYRIGGGVDLGKYALFDVCLQGQGNNATTSMAAFHVPYSIVADLGILFGSDDKKKN